MKLGIIGYAPRENIPPKVCSPRAFMENITRFKTRAPLVLYSDGHWPEAEVRIPNPETVPNTQAKLKNGWPNTFVLNNLIFFTGLRIALRRGFTHILYLEADCRVGRDFWDQEIFEFHFSHREPLVASGTAVTFNPCSHSREAHLRWKQFIDDQKCVPGFGVGVYGWGGQSYTTEKPTVFVNGALGCYEVVWLQKLFGLDGLPPDQTKDNCKELAERTFAWDFALGYELWKHCGIHSYDLIANNPNIYSGFGDTLSSEDERLELVRNGTLAACHQVKSSATV